MRRQCPIERQRLAICAQSARAVTTHPVPPASTASSPAGPCSLHLFIPGHRRPRSGQLDCCRASMRRSWAALLLALSVAGAAAPDSGELCSGDGWTALDESSSSVPEDVLNATLQVGPQ